MAAVDPDDDSVLRYEVRHHRFDPERRERRHVILAAYDTEREMLDHFAIENAALKERQAAGLADEREHLSGSIRPAGHAAEMRTRRAASRGIKQRVRRRKQ